MSIHIILENTSHPGNIGAVARAMYTMDIDQLVLLNPCELNDEAYVRARGGSALLDTAIIIQSPSDLGCYHTLYGTTSRQRSLNLPTLPPKGWVTHIQQESSKHEVAILFGNEQSGLSNELLNLCQGIIEIPAKSGHSLNLSHAVQIICYELFQQDSMTDGLDLSTLEDRIAFIHWLQKYYKNSSFLLPHTLTRIQTIINKAKLTPTELNLMYSLIQSSQTLSQNNSD